MFDRFSERARKTMSFARQEAQRFHHDYIGTEHMLLGLLDEGTGVAVQALRDLGAESDAVRAAVEKIVKTGSRPVPTGQIPFTPRGKRVLEFSLEEAQSLGHDHIGTEHLLLGLARAEKGVASMVLIRDMGLSVERIRTKVVELVPAIPNAARAPSAGEKRSRLRCLGLLGLLGLLGFVDERLGYLGFLGFLGFLGVIVPRAGSRPHERR
jgi:ATP-dependent Clp protease ATP-binding subunit ClpC